MNAIVIVLCVAAAAAGGHVRVRRALPGGDVLSNELSDEQSAALSGLQAAKAALAALATAAPSDPALAPAPAPNNPFYTSFAALPSNGFVATVQSNYPALPYASPYNFRVAPTAAGAVGYTAGRYLPPAGSNAEPNVGNWPNLSGGASDAAPVKADGGSPVLYVPGAGVLAVKHEVNVNKVVSVQRGDDERDERGRWWPGGNNSQVGGSSGGQLSPGGPQPGANNGYSPVGYNGQQPATNNGSPIPGYNGSPLPGYNGQQPEANNGNPLSGVNGQQLNTINGSLYADIIANKLAAINGSKAWWTPGAKNWSSGAKNWTSGANNWAPGANTGAPGSNNRAPGSNNWAPGANNWTSGPKNASPAEGNSTPAGNDWSNGKDSPPLLIFAPGAGVVAVRHIVNVNKVVSVRRGGAPAARSDQLVAVNGDQLAAINAGPLPTTAGGQRRTFNGSQLGAISGPPKDGDWW